MSYHTVQALLRTRPAAWATGGWSTSAKLFGLFVGGVGLYGVSQFSAENNVKSKISPISHQRQSVGVSVDAVTLRAPTVTLALSSSTTTDVTAAIKRLSQVTKDCSASDKARQTTKPAVIREVVDLAVPLLYDADVAREYVKTIWVLCGGAGKQFKKGDSIVAAVHEAGGFDVLLSAMEAHPHDVNIQRVGCETIAITAHLDNKATDSMVSKGCLKLVFAAMDNFRHNNDEESLILLGVAVTSLIPFASYPEHFTQVLESYDGIRRIFEMMDDHPGSTALTAMTFRTLADIVPSAGPRLASWFSKGRLDRVFAAIDRNANVPIFQQYAATLLGRIGSTDSLVIVKEGGLPKVCAYMERELTNADVQGAGLVVLLNSTSVGGDTALKVMKDRGIERIIAAVNRHPDNDRVLGFGLVAFERYATMPPLKAKLVEKGVVPVLMSLMDKHANNARVQAKILPILCKLAYNDVKTIDAMLSAGVLNRVLADLEKHTNSMDVQWPGVGLLAILVQTNAAAKATVDAGAVPSALAVMLALDKHVGVQEDGLGYFLNVLYHAPELTPIIASAGVAQLAQRVKTAFPGTEAAKHAASIIQRLADYEAKTKKK